MSTHNLVRTAAGWAKGIAVSATFAFVTLAITAVLVMSVPERFVDVIVFAWVGSVILVAWLARRHYTGSGRGRLR